MAFNHSVVDDICEHLAEGQTLREIFRRPGMPSHSTVLRWVSDSHEGCAQHYARARDFGYGIMTNDGELLKLPHDGRVMSAPAAPPRRALYDVEHIPWHLPLRHCSAAPRKSASLRVSKRRCVYRGVTVSQAPDSAIIRAIY